MDFKPMKRFIGPVLEQMRRIHLAISIDIETTLQLKNNLDR